MGTRISLHRTIRRSSELLPQTGQEQGSPPAISSNPHSVTGRRPPPISEKDLRL